MKGLTFLGRRSRRVGRWDSTEVRPAGWSGASGVSLSRARLRRAGAKGGQGREGPRPAKINLALVVGPTRGDGKHEVATVLQRVDLGDRVTIAPAPTLAVSGFPGDTIVRDALTALASAAGVEPRWQATIAKRIPVAAGLGGGSSDAATALRLANGLLDRPLAPAELSALAATIGADVPFFLADGPQLGRGDGAELEPLELPQDYWIVLALPHGAVKRSTAEVYRSFDERAGHRRLGGTAGGPGAGARRRSACSRPRGAAVQRPRVLAPRRRAAPPRRVPSRRHGRRSRRLRPLPPQASRRRGATGPARGRARLADRSRLVRLNATLVAWNGR